MESSASEPKPNEPGLNYLDRLHLERLLKAGQVATAVKLYRSACRCSIEEAELAVESLAKSQHSV